MTEFDADFNVETNIKLIKIVFVFVLIFAFKKSITSKKKFVKTNSNVDDLIIIMINQLWFWIFFRSISEFFRSRIIQFFQTLNVDFFLSDINQITIVFFSKFCKISEIFCLTEIFQPSFSEDHENAVFIFFMKNNYHEIFQKGMKDSTKQKKEVFYM